MKEYHILIACGSGIATSTVIANRVKNLSARTMHLKHKHSR